MSESNGHHSIVNRNINRFAPEFVRNACASQIDASVEVWALDLAQVFCSSLLIGVLTYIPISLLYETIEKPIA